MCTCVPALHKNMHYRGEFTVGNETYSVEPVDGTLTGSHRIYRESDVIQLQLRCGMDTRE